MNIDDLMWLVTAIAIAGTFLNARQNIWCFPIWIASNFCWIAYGIYKGTYAMAGMFGVYLVLAIYGWVCWKGLAGTPKA